MLSKEDKLKYGEMLRMQIKEKEQKKKIQDMEKKGVSKSRQPQRPIEKQNTAFDKKQQLQRRFENQNFNPYGRPGGGAPSKYPGGQPIQYQQNNQMPREYPSEHPYGIPSMPNRINTQQQSYPYDNGQMLQKQTPQLVQQYPQYSPSPYDNYSNQQPQNMQQYQSPQNYNQANIYARGPPVYSQGNQSYLNYQNKMPPQQYYAQQQGYPAQYNVPIQQKQAYYNEPRQQAYIPISSPAKQQASQRQRTYEQQDSNDIFKKGARNLLLLENKTIQQINIKQQQKQKLQQYLKFQIQQAQRKKNEQKQRLKRQQQQEERKRVQYAERQRRMIEDAERKQKQAKRKLQEDNQRNLQRKKQMEEAAKRAEEEKRLQQQRRKNVVTISHNPSIKPNQQYGRQVQVRIQDDSSSSMTSTIMQQGFNTDISKQFFKKQRQRDPDKFEKDKKLQVFTQQLQKMRDQISNQGLMFEKQIQKVKMEAQRALEDKKRADQQLVRLKQELRKKMDDENKKLFQALQRNSRPNYQELPTKKFQKNEYYDQPPQSPLRPKKQQTLVNKKYSVPDELSQTNQFNDGLQSLVGDSKKIPINLPKDRFDKLTMSRLDQYAQDSSFFKSQLGKSPKKNQKQKNNYNTRIKQSIVEVEEDRMISRQDSRKSKRKPAIPKPQNNSFHRETDELDKLMQSRQKSRGGGLDQMSSVNSDITKQIQQLLKQKGTVNSRPNSKMSNAGKQSLRNHGLAYEGISLNSINSGNTFDIDNYNNKNEDRLKKLKNLGVQTINTNNDQDLDKLDVLLRQYQGK